MRFESDDFCFGTNHLKTNKTKIVTFEAQLKQNWKKNRKNNENLTKIGTFEEFLNEKQKKMWKIYIFCQFSMKNDEKWLKIYSEDSHFRDMRILPIPGTITFSQDFQNIFRRKMLEFDDFCLKNLENHWNSPDFHDFQRKIVKKSRNRVALRPISGFFLQHIRSQQ